MENGNELFNYETRSFKMEIGIISKLAHGTYLSVSGSFYVAGYVQSFLLNRTLD